MQNIIVLAKYALLLFVSMTKLCLRLSVHCNSVICNPVISFRFGYCNLAEIPFNTIIFFFKRYLVLRIIDIYPFTLGK